MKILPTLQIAFQIAMVWSILFLKSQGINGFFWLLKLTIITLPNITVSLFLCTHYNLGARKHKPWYRPDELAAHHGTMVLSQAKDTQSGLLLLKKIWFIWATALPCSSQAFPAIVLNVKTFGPFAGFKPAAPPHSFPFGECWAIILYW